MNTLYITNQGFITLDPETGAAKEFNSVREGISRIFVAAEPMKIIYNVGGKQGEMQAEVDDIIITFYENCFEKPVVVAKSKDWVDNIKSYEKRQQEAKEKWAAENSDKCEGCNPHY